MSTNETARAKFQPGQVVATPGAIEAMTNSGQNAQDFLGRHLRGDWDDLDDEDCKLNDEALDDGSRLLSAYLTNKGVKIWIITEAQGDDGHRASTCVLLPEDY